MVTQADIIKRKEQDYIMKLRSQNMMSEKAFQEVAKSNASLRWQDSVQNFAVNRSMNTSIDSLVANDEPKPPVP